MSAMLLDNPLLAKLKLDATLLLTLLKSAILPKALLKSAILLEALLKLDILLARPLSAGMPTSGTGTTLMSAMPLDSLLLDNLLDR